MKMNVSILVMLLVAQSGYAGPKEDYIAGYQGGHKSASTDPAKCDALKRVKLVDMKSRGFRAGCQDATKQIEAEYKKLAKQAVTK